jgi:hypothetical protein
MILNKIKGIPNSGGLIKFSTSISRDEKSASEITKKFIAESMPILTKMLK